MEWRGGKIYKILLIALVLGAVLLVVSFWSSLKPVVLPPKGDVSEHLPLSLPGGFSAQVFADDVPGARVMMHGPDGKLWVSETSKGVVATIADRDGDGRAETITPLITGLRKPHGLESRCDDEVCRVYVAEEHQVTAYDFDKESGKLSAGRNILDLPFGSGHFTRSLLWRPYPNEDELLVSVGSSCNVCREEDSRRASVIAYNTKTGKSRTFAKGLRNSVFMAIQPVNGEIWATEMGRDWLGNDLPPDEINILMEGKNFGWPVCSGKNIHDTDFDKNTYIRNPCMELFEIPSHIDIPAHSAPLGIAFFPEEGWPEEYWYNALVAYHGSWNRTEPTGYKIVRYRLDSKGKYLGEEDFATGFLKDGEAWGRPVGILIEPGGVIYISDDKAGAIYKITNVFERQ